MGVIIIPHNEAPHRYHQSTQPKNNFIIDSEDDFPPLAGTPSTNTNSPIPNPGGTCKRNEVVRVGVSTVVTFDLPRLPLELCEKIYEEVMRQDQYLDEAVWVAHHTNSNPIFPSFLPIVCFASKRTFKEAVPVYIRNTQFVVNSVVSNKFLTTFLESLLDSHDGVKQLSFPWFDCFPGMDKEDIDCNLDLELMSRCGALNSVKITFHVKQLREWCLYGDYDEDGLTSVPKTLSEIIKHYNFEQIFNSGNLRKIIWQGIGSYWLEDATCGSLRNVLAELATWVETEFLQRNNQKIQTEIIWRY